MRVFSLEKCHLLLAGDDKPASGEGGDDSHLKIQVITFWLDLPHPILRIPSGENGGLEDGIPIQPKMLSYVILLLTVILEGWRAHPKVSLITAFHSAQLGK